MAAVFAYVGLFASALLVATILPMQSEAVLRSLLLTNAYPPHALVAVVSAGRVLDPASTVFLDAVSIAFAIGPGFRSNRRCSTAPQTGVAVWKWSLLASWVPVVGDPLTVIAGVLREPFWSFVILVGIAKTTRYVLLAPIVSNWT